MPSYLIKPLASVSCVVFGGRLTEMLFGINRVPASLDRSPVDGVLQLGGMMRVGFRPTCHAVEGRISDSAGTVMAYGISFGGIGFSRP